MVSEASRVKKLEKQPETEKVNETCKGKNKSKRVEQKV